MKSFIQELFSFFEKRLRANHAGYWKEFAPYLFFVFLAAMCDFISTYRYMSTLGIDLEMHPVIRWVSYLFGPFFGPLIGKACQLAFLVFVTVLFRPYARLIFIPVILLYLYAAWYNIWGFQT